MEFDGEKFLKSREDIEMQSRNTSVILVTFEPPKLWISSDINDMQTSLDLSTFNTYNINTMSNMFSNCSSIEYLDLSSFKTDALRNMDYMFNYCTNLKYLNLSQFDAVNIASMIYTFKGKLSQL